LHFICDFGALYNVFGAILNSRIDRLVYGTENLEEGFTKFLNVDNYRKWQLREIISGVERISARLY